MDSALIIRQIIKNYEKVVSGGETQQLHVIPMPSCVNIETEIGS